MKSGWIGLFLFLGACSEDASLPGASIKPKTAQSAPTSEKVDNSVMGQYFHFERPQPNLLVRRGKKADNEEKDPPALTGQHIAAATDLVEFSLQIQLTEAQKAQLRDAVIVEYEAGGERRDGVLSAPLSWISMEQLYRKTKEPADRQSLLTKNKELFIKSVEASPDFLYKRVLQSIIDESTRVVAEGTPAFTQHHLNASLEMFEFIMAVYLQRPFTFSAEDREAVSNALISAYQNLPPVTKDLFAKSERNPDVLWMMLRFQWATMEPEQKQKFRASLVNVFGYPVFKGSEEDGAKALIMAPDSALSVMMRQLITPKLGQLLKLVVQMPTAEPEMISYVIYEY